MKDNQPKSARISVIIPTFNRAALLRSALDSFAQQSIPSDLYEVIVVDDGSWDTTPALCMDYSARIGLRYYKIGHSGICAAKNLGIFLSAAPLLLFFDDDDIADCDLLGAHLRAHDVHPQENIAVLGHTVWAPGLQVTELMRYITDIGCFLFSYGNLVDGEMLDFTYFWGGRSSCKRSFLTKHGTFNPLSEAIEDIELGYRLAKFGLQVTYWCSAQQYANRPFTFESFCQRCERQGRAYFHFARLHKMDPIVERYCQIQNAEARWEVWKQSLHYKVARVHELEALLGFGRRPNPSKNLLDELHSLYQWCFNAYRTKGIVESMKLLESTSAVEAAHYP